MRGPEVAPPHVQERAARDQAGAVQRRQGAPTAAMGPAPPAAGVPADTGPEPKLPGRTPHRHQASMIRRAAAGGIWASALLLWLAPAAGAVSVAQENARPGTAQENARPGTAQENARPGTAQENARPGSFHWRAHEAPGRAGEGYVTDLSTAAGRTVRVHVSTRWRYRIEVYRLGWYRGAGSRLLRC